MFLVHFFCPECGEEIYEENVEVESSDVETGIFLSCDTCDADFCVDVDVDVNDEIVGKINASPNVQVTIKQTFEQLTMNDVDLEADLRAWRLEDLKSGLSYSSPHQRWTLTVDAIREMTSAAGGVLEFGLFHRMVFIQYINAVEAYLSDTLKTILINFPDIRSNFLANHSVGSSTVTLRELDAQGDSGVERLLIRSLNAASFHQVDTIDEWYRAAIGASPFSSTKHRNDVKALAFVRHDCVHRDGKSKDGDVLTFINASYCSDAHKVLQEVVQNVEKLFQVQNSELSARRIAILLASTPGRE